MSLYRGYFVPGAMDPFGLSMAEYIECMKGCQNKYWTEGRDCRQGCKKHLPERKNTIGTECVKTVTISLTKGNFEDGSAANYNTATSLVGPNINVNLNPENPDFAEAIKQIKSELGSCTITKLIIAGHGGSGRVEPFDSISVNDPDSMERRFLDGLCGLFSESAFGTELRACCVAAGPKGEQFLGDLSSILGTGVIGWDDTYAIIPHGREFTGFPDGTCRQTGDTLRRYSGSAIQYFSGSEKNSRGQQHKDERGNRIEHQSGKPFPEAGLAGFGSKDFRCEN